MKHLNPDKAAIPRLPRAETITLMSCALVQPLLRRVVRQIATRHPNLFERLGSYRTIDYLIDPIDFPFALHLRPDPLEPLLRAVSRDVTPDAGATIRGRFLTLLRLLDSSEDGDAAFFSRDLEVSGDTEAIVRLRNALDDLDGSIAEEVANMFGPPGRAILGRLRQMYLRRHSTEKLAQA